jgi:uncharacterized protein (DUF302 family)
MTTWTETQVTTKLSPRSVPATVSRLTGILSAKGMKVFAVIDQSDQARDAGLQLRETTLVIFGNPAAGTPVMDAAAIAARYGLSAELAANLAGIDPLTDALVAP